MTPFLAAIEIQTEESRRRSGGLIFKNNPSLLIGALGVNRR
jgi:hypothetical protein